MMNECTSSAGRFDGHGSAPEQYRRHRPMRHVQGYSRSHWMPAPGDYLLRIAPASARATVKQTTINKYTNKAGRFDGHRDAAVRYRVHRPMEEVQGFTRSHWMPPLGKYCGRNMQPVTYMPFFFEFFHCQLVKKGCRLMLRPLFSIGVLHIKRKRRA